MLKQDLRKEIRERKSRYDSGSLRLMSREIIAKLLLHPRIKNAKTVLMYYSLGDEVDTHDAVDELLSMGKQVVLPVVTGSNSMELRLYMGRKCLKSGAFGIEEPVGEPFTQLETIDVAVVPGMAFDVFGNRLGRGKGYYDNFFASSPYIYKIGVCFDFQKVEHVPTDENDVRMDEIL